MSSKNKNINNKVNNLLRFNNLQVDVQKEIEIILIRSHKSSSFWKGCQSYQNIMDPAKGQVIQAEIEPMNFVNKYAVEAIRGGHVVEYLKIATSKKFEKTIFCFLKCDENNRCWVKVTDK